MRYENAAAGADAGSAGVPRRTGWITPERV